MLGMALTLGEMNEVLTALSVVGTAAAALLVTWFLASSVTAQRLAGDVICTLEPPANRRWMLASLVGLAVVVTSILLVDVVGLALGSPPTPSILLAPVNPALVLVLLSRVALSGRQARERGIWEAGGLITWERVEAYEWCGHDRAGLALRHRYWGILRSWSCVPIPPEHRDTIDARLRAHGLTPLRERAASSVLGA